MKTGSPSCDADVPDRADHAVDHARIERAVREILLAVGENPDREGLLETPARVARMYAEMFSGLHTDPKVHLRKAFTEKYDEIVLVRDIAFNSVCEHHLLPFMGHAHIGYLPNGRVLGLSKLARVVEALSHRPQVQERMTEQIADLLVHDLGAKGVAVVVEASHTCMTIRGVRKPGSVCVTSAMKGLFRSNISSRNDLCCAGRGVVRMRLLVDFLCRFGWGLSVALVLTPSSLVPAGFFRVNMLVVLGLATFAALLCGQALPAYAWLLPAAAAVTAWMASIAWFAERTRPGIVLCVITAILLAAATAVVQVGADGTLTGGWPHVGVALLSGLVTGLTVHAMLLGHWYLNAPGMRVDVLRRMIDIALAAWAVQLVVATAAALPAGALAAGTTGGPTTMALVSLRWLAGLAGLPVLLWLSRKTLEIPNTQSATGILYVACLAAILGELTAQLLSVAA